MSMSKNSTALIKVATLLMIGVVFSYLYMSTNQFFLSGLFILISAVFLTAAIFIVACMIPTEGCD